MAESDSSSAAGQRFRLSCSALHGSHVVFVTHDPSREYGGYFGAVGSIFDIVLFGHTCLGCT